MTPVEPPLEAPIAPILTGRSRHLGDEAVRYAIAGAISAVVEFGMFFIFDHYCAWSTTWATIGGQSASIVVNYLLSAFWVFRWRRHPRIAVELPCFLLIAAIGMTINVTAMNVAEQALDVTGLAAKVPSSILVAIWAIAAKRLWLFARPRHSAP